jgi:hypothetical protein
MISYNKDALFFDVPDNSDDPLAQKAEQYLINEKRVPEHKGITIRVTKKQSRYYVSEWRVGKQSFSGQPVEHAIARISPVKGKKDQWQLAWMRSNRKWYDLGDGYCGSFEYCLEMIVEDPFCCFWG